MACSLQKQLQALLRTEVEVRFHQNRKNYMSLTFGPALMIYSLHECFIEAPQEVVKSLAQFARRKTPYCQRIVRQFYQTWTEKHAKKEPISPLQQIGNIHDLGKLYAKVKKEPLCSKLDLAIIWSVKSSSLPKKRKSLLLGSYCSFRRLITIHRILDHCQVPEYFLCYLIYHEMLHAVFPPQINLQAKRSIHTQQFKQAEKNYKDYIKARLWLKRFKERGFHYGRT